MKSEIAFEPPNFPKNLEINKNEKSKLFLEGKRGVEFGKEEKERWKEEEKEEKIILQFDFFPFYFLFFYYLFDFLLPFIEFCSTTLNL